MVAGVAVKLVISAFTGAALTVTVAFAVSPEPPFSPLQLNVYVVVIVGLTDCVPLVPTAPTPWLIVQPVPTLTLHESIELWPLVIVFGLAVKLVISALTGAGLTVTVA